MTDRGAGFAWLPALFTELPRIGFPEARIAPVQHPERPGLRSAAFAYIGPGEWVKAMSTGVFFVGRARIHVLWGAPVREGAG
jgi:hypothetical protein